MDSKTKLFDFKVFFETIPTLVKPISNSYIAEIAGKDSIAAIIQAIEDQKIESVIGIGIYHRGFYGNIDEPVENYSLFQNFLVTDHLISYPIIYLNISDLFERLIIKNSAIIQKYFKYFNPCPACHLLFHMMRIPVAQHYNIRYIITGERIYHGNIQKLNQHGEILSKYKKYLEKHQINLIQPLLDIQKDEEIYQLLGKQWNPNILPCKCMFSKNYYDEDGEIPFDLKNIISSLENFYFPLFSSVVKYIISNKEEPNSLWIRAEISRITKKLKN
ncbi:MAG: hypothetical protein GY870_13350 [archaeon]|nr:hypothetical protein [archaeon]